MRILLLHVREESHEAGTFDGLLNRALLLGSEARALAAHDAAVRVHELLEKLNVFVIDVADIILREDVCHIGSLRW